jgi:hypothetical protein
MTDTYAPNDDSSISPAVYLIPVINASNYPPLGVALRTAGGCLGLNEDKVSNYSGYLVSQPIDFDFMQIDSIIMPCLNSLNCRFEAEAKNYGTRLNIIFPFQPDLALAPIARFSPISPAMTPLARNGIRFSCGGRIYLDYGKWGLKDGMTCVNHGVYIHNGGKDRDCRATGGRQPRLRAL